MALKFLPPDPVFYLKMKASLIDNKVAVFEPEKFEIGRMSLPVSAFLSLIPPSLINTAYAENSDSALSDLSKIQNKRTAIINYINSRIILFKGFYAKDARFTENGVIFKGTLPATEASVR
jgi:hypothetical protein